ncbi:hypothetical protein AYO40_01275 [Planctomycetaceae bacterium SCGC AG-212-D15]|nr:hypothetical protein AYO40_01275 [Planctomycetaceae bacterium SCGC AG-212-D15]
MRWTIAKRALGITLVTTSLMLAVAAAGYWGIHRITRSVARAHEETVIADNAALARIYVLELRRYEKDMFLNCLDSKRVKSYHEKYLREDARLGERLRELESLTDHRPEDRRLVDVMGRGADIYVRAMKTIIPKVEAGEIKTPQAGNQAIVPYKDAMHEMEDAAEALAQQSRERMDSATGEVTGVVATTLSLMLGFAGLAVILGFTLSALVARSISQDLRGMIAIVKDIAEGDGDLTRRADGARRDEIGEMALWLNSFIARVHDVVARAKTSVRQVAQASQTLSAASELLATGSQEQASSLEETAASLEQITSSVKQNADNAREANQLAIGSRGTAHTGGDTAMNTVTAMQEINQSSQKVAEIISTIDEIAFQTNLLALNAAVEAARAGDQGRGFAVVAAEVRNLAQRSAQAAKEIKALIQDSRTKVAAGSDLVRKSGENLQQIVVSVNRVTEIMGEIAASSQEQFMGIEQVNRAVAQMDGVVQQSAAQTEELSSTAQSLSVQAAELHALMKHFKVLELDLPTAPSALSLTESGSKGKPGARSVSADTRSVLSIEPAEPRHSNGEPDLPGRRPRGDKLSKADFEEF